jgi:hypothetical protein
MRHVLLTAALALLVAATACKKKPEPAAGQSAAPGDPYATAVFTLRDLALATSFEARLARLSLAGADTEAAVLAKTAKERREAAGRLAETKVALAEVEKAFSVIRNPLDGSAAALTTELARNYVSALGSASREQAPRDADLAPAREALGKSIAVYRAARSRWRLDAPTPEGAEREFAETRRVMERAEADLGQRGAPDEARDRDQRRGFTFAAMMAKRTRRVADELPPALREPVQRYLDAQTNVLKALDTLRFGAAKQQPAASRAYQGAKADALAALADYFAAVASR